MSRRQVRTIPATLTRFTAAPLAEQRKRRVAGYARVSTDHDEQFTSYEAQIDYYTKFIKGRADWEFVDVYTDEGITGTSTRHRQGFNRMIDDALAGKIDLIVTKSVSRFARNTVDSLTTIRKLKEKGVECYFEKENIWTFDGKGELLITIMSSLAQEESRSISENCTWGQRKRMQDGKVSVPFGRFLGYDRGPNGELVINPEQAELVRRIYRMFLQGLTPHSIAGQLTKEGVPTVSGRAVWSSNTIKSILTNEKYKGDALLQKWFTEDYLTKRLIRNTGQLHQYYVAENHEAIISPDVFEIVQEMMSSRLANESGRYSGVSAYSGLITCGECGSMYGSKVWHSNDRYRRVIWQCNRKYKGSHCSCRHLTETQIREAFLKAFAKLDAQKAELFEAFEAIKESVYGTSALQQELDRALAEIAGTTDMLNSMIRQNAMVAQDQSEYNRRYAAVYKRFEELRLRSEELQAQINDKNCRRVKAEEFFATLMQKDCVMTEFDPAVFRILVERIRVNTDKTLLFTFKDGTEITV